MPTSARWEVANSPQIFVKTVHSVRADVGIGPYAVLRPQAHVANFLGTDTAVTNNGRLFWH